MPLPAPGEKRHRTAGGRKSDGAISAAPTCLSPRRGEVSRSDGEGPLDPVFPLSGAAAPALPTLPRGASISYFSVNQLAHSGKFPVDLSIAEAQYPQAQFLQSFIPDKILPFPANYVLASPRTGERCREATERGRLIQCSPLRRCRASSPHAAARGEPRGWVRILQSISYFSVNQLAHCAFYSLSRISRSIISHTAANSWSISRLLKRNTRRPSSFSRSSRTRSLSFSDSS